MNAEKPSFVPQTNWIYYASLAPGALHHQARAQTSLVFQSLCPRTPYSSLCWFHPEPSPCSDAFYSAVLSHLIRNHKPTINLPHFPHFFPLHGHRHRRQPTRPRAILSNIPLIPRKITSSRTILARPLFLPSRRRGHLGTTGTDGARGGKEGGRGQRGPLVMMVTAAAVALLAWHSRSRGRKSGGKWGRSMGALVWPGLSFPPPPSLFHCLTSTKHRSPASGDLLRCGSSSDLNTAHLGLTLGSWDPEGKLPGSPADGRQNRRGDIKFCSCCSLASSPPLPSTC